MNFQTVFPSSVNAVGYKKNEKNNSYYYQKFMSCWALCQVLNIYCLS